VCYHVSSGDYNGMIAETHVLGPQIPAALANPRRVVLWIRKRTLHKLEDASSLPSLGTPHGILSKRAPHNISVTSRPHLEANHAIRWQFFCDFLLHMSNILCRESLFHHTENYMQPVRKVVNQIPIETISAIFEH
jgi:hypothetical protein